MDEDRLEQRLNELSTQLVLINSKLDSMSGGKTTYSTNNSLSATQMIPPVGDYEPSYDSYDDDVLVHSKDVLNKTFDVRFRGYDVQQVDEYLDRIYDTLTSLERRLE